MVESTNKDMGGKNKGYFDQLYAAAADLKKSLSLTATRIWKLIFICETIMFGETLHCDNQLNYVDLHFLYHIHRYVIN
jgi:hypothetical protein